jgi:hypothetical protein
MEVRALFIFISLVDQIPGPPPRTAAKFSVKQCRRFRYGESYKEIIRPIRGIVYPAILSKLDPQILLICAILPLNT